MSADGPLTVLHVRTSDVLGGPERLILDQSALGLPGLRPVLASFVRQGEPHPFLDEAERLGLRTVRVPQSGSYDPRLVPRLARVMRDVDPDVVVGHDYKADLLIRLASVRVRRRPWVAIIHGFTAQSRRIRLFESVDRRLLRGADVVVCVSEPQRTDLVAAGISAERIRVVENGVPVDRVASEAREGRARVRAQWGAADSEFIVLCLGRLSVEKGPDVLLEAFASACLGPAARLVLVGDGASRAALEARSSELVGLGRLLPEHVRFAGWRSDPWACLGACDLLVLPSRREGLPLTLLEAMAAGVPVLATEVGGMPTALCGGRCGVLVAPDDAAALAEGLRLSAADARLRDALREAASIEVRSRYGIERQATALADAYLAASRARPRAAGLRATPGVARDDPGARTPPARAGRRERPAADHIAADAWSDALIRRR